MISPTRVACLLAAEHGETEALEAVLKEDPTAVLASDEDGYTPLHRAAYNGHLTCCKILLGKGADPNVPTKEGWRPAHCAARWGKCYVLDLLLQNGADVNAQTNSGLTPLHLASQYKRPKAVMVLLSRKDLDILKVNSQGETAYKLALRTGCAPYYAWLPHNVLLLSTHIGEKTLSNEDLEN
eukprot:Colp12_sorted_trinity150504_noHs@32176